MVDITTPNPTLQQLLSDLEKQGGFYKANFKEICESADGFYGAKGSEVRRRYQQALDRLCRRKSALEYKKLVEENGVAPSASTVQNAMEELKKAMAGATVANPKQPETETKATPVSKVSFQDDSRRSNTPPPHSLFTPPPSPGRSLFKSMQTPDMSISSATEASAEEMSLSHDPTIGWSASNPHIIPVTKPNMVLPHGFVSMFSDACAGFGQHERDIYFLSRLIGGDLKFWKASTPSMFHEYRGRCILVEGPALDYVQTDPAVMIQSLNETTKLTSNPIPSVWRLLSNVV